MTKINLCRVAEKINQMVLSEIKSNGIENYKDDTLWTDFMLGNENMIFKAFEDPDFDIYEYKREGTYSKDRLYFQKELNKIDASVWSSTHDREKLNEFTTSRIWRFEAIIEHENNGQRWLEEMQKICSINAPKKLLITYGRTTEGYGKKLLNIATEIAHNISNSVTDEFIIMFGYTIDEINTKLENGNLVNDVFEIVDFRKHIKKYCEYSLSIAHNSPNQKT